MIRPKIFQLSLAALIILTSGAGGASMDSAAPAVLSPQAAAKKIANVSVPFIENRGQISSNEVQYYAKTFAGTLFVTSENQLVYSLPRKYQKNPRAVWVFRESFVGRHPTRPHGEIKSPVRVSYYKGNDPRAWRRQLTAFDSIGLGELYPGISVSLKAAGNNVEKLFYISPNAAPDAIKIKVNGVQSLDVDDQGQLVLATTLGDIVFTAPIAYQVVNGRRQAVDAAYTLAGNHYGFKVGQYDKNYELVIDPLLASTYIGGHNPSPPGNYDDDIIHGMVVTEDAVYIAGATQSPDFPIVSGYNDTLDNAYPDGFITQLDRNLSGVIASTYIGTQYFDRVQDIAMDDEGLIIAVGQAGYGFPVTPGAYTWSGTTPVGGGFIAKFKADLSDLVASAVVTPSDYPLRVALGNGGIYFGGRTNNPDFPITPGAYRSTCCPAGGFGIRESDGFAGKISSDLVVLEAMTYLGGDSVSGISVEPEPGDTVFISDGSDNAITGYLARFDADLTERLAYLSYYPGSTSGSSRTYFNDVAVGPDYVVAAGQTYMNDLPATVGAFDTDCGTDGVCDGIGSLLVPRPDGFVAEYSLDLQETLALTYLGGSDAESCRSVALDGSGNVYVTGETISTDFPTSFEGGDTSCGTDGQCNPTGTYNTPVADGFVAKLSADLSSLLYGSYIGGSGEDRPNVIAVNNAGHIYAAGYTRSADFPTTAGAFDRSYNGGTSDAFVSEIDPAGGSTGGGGGTPTGNVAPVADAGEDQAVGSRQRVYLDGRGSSDPDGQIIDYRWTQSAGKAVSIRNAESDLAYFTAPRVRRGAAQTLEFQLEVTDDQDATAVDRVAIQVTR